MKKHIDWGRALLCIGIFIVLSIITYIIHWSLYHGWHETNEWWSWIFTILILFAGIVVFGAVVGGIIWLIDYIYHNGEDKKE